jgi:fructosamine-3-kinase
MFGFHVTRYNGTLERDNAWTDSCERFYALGTVRTLALEKSARGPNLEPKKLSKELLDMVIPRLLRPLETQGRKVKPSPLHGDLWVGNVANNKSTGKPMIFDSSAFYSYHECESEVCQASNIRESTKIPSQRVL